MIFKAGEGAGRSGSFFFFSHDQKFVVKTMTGTELNLLKKMTPGYAQYMKNFPDSLLSKILGIFTVEAEKFSKVHIMIMENTIRLKDPKKLRYVFDLKGSMVDRLVKGPTKTSSTLKDLNLLMIKKKKKGLTTLSEATSRRLVQAMRKDVFYLRSQNLMDYSLLVAIESCREP
jgi:Phosphatidylinositol-4-phosphate 5-Kinase